jgi:UDP-N-acetylglucosamine pyrophosphorylase
MELLIHIFPHIKMKFPITRESLQAFDYAKEQEELREEEIQKTLSLILEELCTEFKKGMSSNSKEKRFVWRKLHIINIKNYSSNKDYIPMFIDKVKETFVGCDIIIDPLKTYLIIDWS